MKKRILLAALTLLSPQLALSQEAVLGVKDPEALFTSSDPKLNANKQVTYKILVELLEANHWEKADLYLTERYLQHNPNAKSGRQAVVAYFTQVLKRKPSDIPNRMQTKIVSVVAEGDVVTVARPYELADPKDASKTYSTTWFDSWRFVDGKADEHWDSALK